MSNYDKVEKDFSVSVWKNKITLTLIPLYGVILSDDDKEYIVDWLNDISDDYGPIQFDNDRAYIDQHGNIVKREQAMQNSDIIIRGECYEKTLLNFSIVSS